MTSDARSDVYKATGVDTAEADAGLNHIIARVRMVSGSVGWAKAGASPRPRGSLCSDKGGP